MYICVQTIVIHSYTIEAKNKYNKQSRCQSSSTSFRKKILYIFFMALQLVAIGVEEDEGGGAIVLTSRNLTAEHLSTTFLDDQMADFFFKKYIHIHTEEVNSSN